jgi:uronate dehydrogenase
MTTLTHGGERLHRILLTGAAGGLGRVLTETMAPYADILRLSDITPIPVAENAQTEVVVCDLSDKAAVDALVDGCDAILHFGGVSVERPFEEILEANIRGVYHLYEAARRHGVKRIVFASSNHVIGFYKQTEKLDARSARRPDGYYGLSKSFGEDVASFYYDRYGIETVSIRIGSSFPEPKNLRMMSTWLSYRDLTQLLVKALNTKDVGHTIVYGASDNRDQWWDNRYAAHLGFHPQDSSEPFRSKIDALPALAADDPNAIYQGGGFIAQGPFDDGPEKREKLPRVALVFDAKNGVGESPVWHAQEQALYWVDIPGKTFNRYAVTSQHHQQWTSPEQIGCIAAAENGTWVAAMETGIFNLRPNAQGTLDVQLRAAVHHAQAGMRFNDGRCDRQGRFWAGTMVMDMSANAKVGGLYRLDQTPQGEVATLVIPDLMVPNGLAFSPDGRTMYLSDSHPSVQLIWAFDYDPATGTPSNRRVFVDMNQYPGRPDGAAIDEDGYYWICANDAGLVHRFSPDGQLDRSLVVPVKKPAMCAFGGANRDVLYVTSIRLPNIDLSDQPLAGGVFALRPGVKGVAEPAFVAKALQAK